MVKRFVTVGRSVLSNCWRFLLLFLDHKYTERYIYIWIRFRLSPITVLLTLLHVNNHFNTVKLYNIGWKCEIFEVREFVYASV